MSNVRSVSPNFTIFLDANVLAKPITRTLLMAAGIHSGYGTTWSVYVEREADHHLRSGQTSVADVRGLAGAELSPTCTNAAEFIHTSLSDRQVIADAFAAEALFIVTEDVNDFAQEDLESVGIAAVNPDLFLSLSATPTGYREALEFIAGRFKNPLRTIEELHERVGRAHPLTATANQSQFSTTPEVSTHNPPTHVYRGNRCLICFQIEKSEAGICSDCLEWPTSDRR